TMSPRLPMPSIGSHAIRSCGASSARPAANWSNGNSRASVSAAISLRSIDACSSKRLELVHDTPSSGIPRFRPENRLISWLGNSGGNAVSKGGMKVKHGMAHSAEYRTWRSINTRCTNPNAVQYPRYGGRGIKVLFGSFEDFYAHVGPRPSAQHSID